MPNLHNIQSSGSGGANNIATSEATTKNKPIIIAEFQVNLQKHINICCYSLNEISIREQKCAARKVGPNNTFRHF